MTVHLQARPNVSPQTADPPALVGARRNPGSVEGFLNLWNLRTLIAKYVWRDFESRFKGSLLGAIWPVLNPLGHLILYTFLFSIILNVKFGGSASTSQFALYMMTGFLPWTAMSEALSSATTKVLEVPNLVKKVVFPLEILPLVIPISSFINCGISLLLIIIFAFFQIGTIHWTNLLLPIVLIPHFLLTVGLCWFFSSIGVFIRDCKHFMVLALAAGMYVTPIVYPAERLPENLRWLLWINPVSGMITDYRRLILEGHLPELVPYLTYTGISIAVCLFGFHFFFKTKNSFADIL